MADTRREAWRKLLLQMADRAIQFGVDSVFYDPLGYCEPAANWDLSGEFPIPNTRVIVDKAKWRGETRIRSSRTRCSSTRSTGRLYDDAAIGIADVAEKTEARS